jgi:cytochrome c-type biogenesis protein CcmE
MVGAQVRRFRRRQRMRQALVWLVALAVIALAAAGLVSVMEALRNYQPHYYEPKDIERQRHETQRLLDDAKSRLSR